MSMKLQQILLYACLLLLLKTNAQQPRFSRIGLSDGLSQSSIYSVFNCSKGFIWLATADGLNRYDGHTIKVYKTALNNQVKGNGNFYDYGVAEAPNHDIYFSGRTGVVCYKAKEDKVEPFFPLNDTAGFNKMMLVLGIVNYNLYLFDCHANIFVYNISSKKLKRISILDPNVNLNVFRYAQMDNQNNIWYSLSNGIACYNIKTNQVRFYLQEAFKKSNLSIFRHISPIKNTNEVLITTAQFVARLNINSGKYTLLLNNPKETFQNALMDANGTVWITSNNAGLFSNNKQGKISNYTHHPNNLESIGTNITNILFIDKSENLWIGCDGQGISKLNLSSNKFKLYRAGYNSTFNFNTNFIKCFNEDANNRIWIGTHNDGLHIWNRKTDDVVKINRKEPNANIVNSIAIINRDATLIGAVAGVYVVNSNTLKQSALHTLQKNEIKNTTYPITHIIKLKPHKFLVSTLWGLYNVQTNNKEVVSSNPISQVPKYMFTQMHLSKNGILWLGTLGGSVVKLNIKGADYFIEKELLDGYNVKSFYEDTIDNMLWMASEKGLISYNLKFNTYKVITTNEGLSDNYLYGILKGEHDELWLSSNKGLMCYHTSSKHVVCFDESDGLQSNEFNTGSFFKSNSGELFFGGINGFNSFYPKEIKFNLNKPNVVLTHLKIKDKEVEGYGNATFLTNIILPHNQNSFSVDFAATEYTNPLKNKYQYKLEGADKNWVNSGSNHFSRYSSLNPGTYLFYARACNNDGIWGNTHKLITVIIKPAWWQTWWAVTLFLTIAGVFSFLSIRFASTRKLKLKLAELEAVNKERTRISKDMHDDLGSGLSKIAIMAELLKPRLLDDAELKRKIEKIAHTASELIDNMGQIVWTMNANNDTLDNLLSYTRAYSLDFFEDTSINFIVNFEEVNNKIMMNQLQRRNVFLVVKETLNNTLKHAHANQVIIQFNIKQQMAHFIISDNGGGFDTHNSKRFGNGLLNMQKRMEAIKGTFFIQSTNQGTTTTLTWQVK